MVFANNLIKYFALGPMCSFHPPKINIIQTVNHLTQIASVVGNKHPSNIDKFPVAPSQICQLYLNLSQFVNITTLS